MDHARGGRGLALLAMMASCAVVGAAVPVAPAAASVSPVVAGQGTATVTLSDDHFHPGDTITVTGAGFVADTETANNPGSPVVALKLNGAEYEETDFVWQAGGASYVDPKTLPMAGGSDGVASYVVGPDGSWSGTIKIPTDWEPVGKHFFSVLGGSLSTAVPGKHLKPTTFPVNFQVLDPDQGFAQVTSTAHAQSAADSMLAVSLRNFGATGGGGQDVGFTVDGAAQVLACVPTDADGDADVLVPLPPRSASVLAAGAHTLNVVTGASCGGAVQAPVRPALAVPFAVATLEVADPALRAGERVGVTARGLVKAGGFGGQRALVSLRTAAGAQVAELGCLRANGSGAASETFTVPADVNAGAYVLNAVTGTSCGDGTDAPVRSLDAAVTVAAAAVASVPVNPTTPATPGPQVPAPPAPPVAKVIGPVKAPSVKGALAVGRTIRAVRATWTVAGVSVKHQWLRNGKPIKKATKASYRLTKADRAKKISVRVTATRAGYGSATQTSKAKKVR